MYRKRYSDAENLAVVRKLVLEAKAQDSTISPLIKGKNAWQNYYWFKPSKLQRNVNGYVWTSSFIPCISEIYNYVWTSSFIPCTSEIYNCSSV